MSNNPMAFDDDKNADKIAVAWRRIDAAVAATKTYADRFDIEAEGARIFNAMHDAECKGFLIDAVEHQITAIANSFPWLERVEREQLRCMLDCLESLIFIARPEDLTKGKTC